MAYSHIAACKCNFYPRSPCGERLFPLISECPETSISIHALLAESDRTLPALPLPIEISIHALLAESDTNLKDAAAARKISIHALLAESDC